MSERAQVSRDTDPGTLRVAVRTLARVPASASDPTSRWLHEDESASLTIVRRTSTGPTSLTVALTGEAITAESHGADPDTVLASWTGVAGLEDRNRTFETHHSAVTDAVRRHPNVRLFATGAVYEELLMAILGQRITGGEAAAQWRRLCRQHGTVDARTDLTCAPAPGVLASLAYHDLHRIGVERRRAETLIRVGRLFAEKPSFLDGDPHLRRRLESVMSGGVFLPGIGPWTAAVVLGRAYGDPDALAVGDWHLKHLVAHALAGRARGTDAEMLEILEPYRGQRHRVVTLLAADGQHAPRFGPRRRILHVGDI